MKFEFGEIVLIRMEFHQRAGGKVRPAVVLLDTGDDDFIAAPVTWRWLQTIAKAWPARSAISTAFEAFTADKPRVVITII